MASIIFPPTFKAHIFESYPQWHDYFKSAAGKLIPSFPADRRMNFRPSKFGIALVQAHIFQDAVFADSLFARLKIYLTIVRF